MTQLQDPSSKALSDELVALRREVATLQQGSRAIQILQGMINDGHIAPESITAEKLASLIVLASKIAIGGETGARLEIDETGITQYASDNDPTMRIGQNPQGGNYLTIVDPDDPSKSLASISDQGIMSATGFTITDNLVYGGNEIGDLFDALPKGVVARGELHNATAGTVTEIGIMELQFTAKPGRIYRIHGSGFNLRPVDMAESDGGFIVRYTTNNTRPTVSSPVLIGFHGNSYSGLFTQSQSATVPIRLLFTCWSDGTFSVYNDSTAGQVGDNGLQVWVEDMGKWISNTGVSSTGGGGGTAPVEDRSAQWVCNWSRSFYASGLRHINGEMYQGYYDAASGDQYSCFGFDDANIRSTISGSTINRVLLWLYAHHWYWNSGGYARIRTHNSGPTNVYPGVSISRWVQHLNKPGGLWITLDTTVGNEFRDNLTKGFALDARDVPRNLLDYGRFDGVGWPYLPILQIDYRK